MTRVDLVIVGFTILLALRGARQGFVVGALSLAGFALGALLGTRLAGALLPSGAHSPYAPMLGLLGALVGGAMLATGLGGVGARLRTGLRFAGLGIPDALAGGLLSAAVALGIAWVAGAAALQVPGQPGLRRDVQRSAILRRLNAALPPSGPLLHALGRLDPLPSLRGPSTDLRAPRAAFARAPGARAAARGVVRVLGTACGLGVEGSGWVAAPELVVTNAHVVAGQTDTTVQAAGSGPHLAAHAVAYDPHDDLAVLRVPGLASPALAAAPAAVPGAGVILGFPENGALSARAARVGPTVTAISQDAYGRGPVHRRMVPLRGVIRHGNSGGPVVDLRGRVLATVFAATVGRRAGGYGVPEEVVRRVLRRARGSVGTGPCTAG